MYNASIPLNNSFQILKTDFVKNVPYQNDDKIFLPKNFDSLKRLINSSY
ncbi:hypothetical protein BTU51_0474 [Rickettsia rickettsii]|uniref:Uncharacterized protein n=1 Tax=Rickettsia rickettsii (strain Iowa) TaxID=452659 RepID=B0BWY0_RICRO|nr:hypothetical protein RrIowa_0474 [Rickettsia rickettsii str. Iowa]APU55308.1 hypothetical protein BTU50_0474 [Rickettsia rickettsii]APU56685.1 hypothetical protein BTU51_0474 [Rickettsia rickettsii]